MDLNDINFAKTNGGLQREPDNDDYKTGFVFLRSYPNGGSAPATPFTIEKITSLSDAESKGLTEAAYPEEYYQLKEYYRLRPDVILHVVFGAAEEANYDFSEVTTLQNYADKELRQVNVIAFSSFVETDIDILHSVAIANDSAHGPLSIIYSADITGMSLALLPDVRSRAKGKVSVVIGMDGANEGKALFDLGNIVPCCGAAIGTVSLSKVNNSIGWVGGFNVANDELDVPAFANGDLYKETDISVLNQLNDYGYIFLRKHVGYSGTYFNDSHTCDLITSDYAYIENNRVIDKAIRLIRIALLPKLGGDYELNSDGTLSLEVITDWNNVCNDALEDMRKNQETSGYLVSIDPSQVVSSTSKLKVKILIVVRGVIRDIDVEIGYGTF